MNIHRYIACDLGAESGRVILGTLQDGVLTLDEMHRFPNEPVTVGGSLRWDVGRLFSEIKAGLARVAASLRDAEMGPADGVSVDSWGVDYVLVGGDGEALALPHHYRDPRTEEPYREVMAGADAGTVFAETGIQSMAINTLYQLLAHQRDEPGQLAGAAQFLPIADYFQARLSGIGIAERSLASTSQFYNPNTGRWSEELVARFGLPAALFPPLVDSGTVLGPLLPGVAAETGLRDVQVIATCSHDTAAAVAAVPVDQDADGDWAYLSSGTWSLLGVERPRPLINDRVRAANFTNEAGYGGTTRFLKNIAGLWIVQECRRAWRTEGTDYTYEELTRLAGEAAPLRSLIHPGDVRFLAPGEMPRKVRDFCRETGQPVPETPGQVVRCALEGLALSYRQTLDQIEALTGGSVRHLHIVGGGCRNSLLNRLAADATGRDVVAGPVEATGIGNLLLQAVALGHLGSLADLRRTVRASFPVQAYVPLETDVWEEPYAKFQQMETRQS